MAGADEVLATMNGTGYIRSSPGGESVLLNLLQRGKLLCRTRQGSTMFQICGTGVQNRSENGYVADASAVFGGVGFMSTREIAILGTGLLMVRCSPTPRRETTRRGSRFWILKLDR